MDGLNITHGQIQTDIKNMDVPLAMGWGWAFGQAMRNYTGQAEPVIAVACDARATSMDTIHGIASGLRTANCKVKLVGSLPEDALAFAVGTYSLDGGAYITGGTGGAGNVEVRFKDEDAAPLPAEPMRDVISFFKNFEYQPGPHPDMEDMQIGEEYGQFLARVAAPYGQWIRQPEPFYVQFNGPLSVGAIAFINVMGALGIPDNIKVSFSDLKLNRTRTPEAMELLGVSVVEEQAALGFYFDDDAGGFHAVDERGQVIHPAHVGALLMASTAARWPDGEVMTDHRLALAGLWAARQSKVKFSTVCPGASHVKLTMRENGATICSTPDGRYYFRDTWWHESGVLAAVLLSHIAYLAPKGLSHMLSGLRSICPSEGPEILTGILNARSVVDKVASKLMDPPYGLTHVNTERGPDGSFIMRSCLAGHDWRVVVTPEEGQINLCCEAYGGEETLALMGHVYEAVKSGITVANIEASVGI